MPLTVWAVSRLLEAGSSMTRNWSTLIGAFWGVCIVTALWLLHPGDQQSLDDGAVEIHFMGPAGPISGALEDSIREFERLSRERNAIDPSYPVYRVVSGQHASRDQVADPTRFLVSVAGGMPPDVIFFDRFAITEWASRGAFDPLDRFIEQDVQAWSAWQAGEGLEPWPGAAEEPPRARGAMALAAIEPILPEAYFESCWNEAIYIDPQNGQQGLYGIPANADNRVLLYNKDILIRHGYVDEDGQPLPPRTWEELEAMALAMTERDDRGNIRSIGFIPNYGNSWLYLYGWQAGGEFMSEDRRTATLNHPRIVDALTFMTRMYDQLGGARAVYAFQQSFQEGALDPFIQGRVAMKIDGVWVMESMAFYGRDLNFGAAPAPLPQRSIDEGMEPISWVGGWAYAIPSSAREKEGAWELIRYLSSQRSHAIMMESQYFTYMSQGRPFLPRQFPHREQNEWAFQTYIMQNEALEDRFKEAMAQFHALLEQSRYRPVTPVGQKLWNAQIWAMEDAIFGRRTPQESLDYYNAIVQRDLDMVLTPPPGIEIKSWNWFFLLYAFLVIVVIRGAYRWDTRDSWRGQLHLPRFLRWFGFLTGGEKLEPTRLEGSKGSYFRAEWRNGVICALPFLIGFIVFTGGPLLFSIVISFSSFDVLNPAIFTGLRNYRFLLFGDELFWISLYNTLFMVMGVPLGMLVGLGIALLLNLKIRGIAVWRTLFYLPSIVPVVAASILWIWIFNPESGLLNNMLAAVGITGPRWLQDPATSKWSLILMGLWGAGGGMIIWLAGLKGIGESYYEAASIDGANAWQRFRYITIPMLTPYIFFNLVMGLIGTFQIFTQAFIMTAGGPVNSTLFYVYHLFNNAFRYLHMGYAAAMAWFLFIIVLAITAFQMKYSNRWVHYEGD
jgi:ABC-type sugar transport system permease subunit/ABC-type glycerol-3-phosphate transport system substrate-binding protein